MSLSKLLFGEIALRKGLVTQAQVDECLEIQKKLKEMGITKTLGAVMHDKKYLSMVEIKEILREMTGAKDWNAIEGYQILEKLGKGGMGSVYKALHTGLKKLVALKVLPPELASDQEYLDRFWREARAAAKLNHPNIVQALDVGESFGYHYFVMEYVDGATVKEMIDREGRVQEAKALHIIAQVTEALVHAYKAEMVHRDIKPSNIIMNKRGVAKLCDLGLAKSLQEDAAITQTGVIMGTPFYLSPEQARNEDLDWRSDIYSLGVTLFHMLTGQVPFTGNTAATILYKHIFMEPPGVRTLKPDLHPATERLVFHMLAKAPGDRPENALVLYDEVCSVLREVAPELVGPDGRLVPLAVPEEEEPAAESAPEPAVAVTGRGLGITGATTGPAAVAPTDMPADTGQVSRSGTGTMTLSGSLPAGPGVSGPVTAGRGRPGRDALGGITGGVTGGVGGVTGSVTGSVTAGVTAPFDALHPSVTVRGGRVRVAAMAASALALLGVLGFVYTEVSALAVVPAEVASARPEVAKLFDGQVRPAVGERLRAAEKHIRAQAFGLAAAEMVEVRKLELTAAEEASVLAMSRRLGSEATAAMDVLNQRYLALTGRGHPGTEVTDLLAKIEALGLEAVADFIEREEDRLKGLAISGAP